MPRQVLFNVQLLRFLAAAAILFTHAASLVIPNSPVVNDVPWVGGVDIFFVISGFIMTWMTRGQFGSRPAAGKFLLRRVVRVVPPYWFFTLGTVVIVIVAGGRIQHTTADPLIVLTSLGFLPWPRADGQLVPILAQGWTLSYEAFFYLAFAACMLVRRGLLILVVFFILLAGLHQAIPERWFVASYFTHPIILEFAAGIFLGRLYLSGFRLGLGSTLAMIAVAVLAYVAMPLPGNDFDRLLQLGVPAGLIAAALILGPEPRRTGPILRALKAGGDASYTLYLSHRLTVGAVLIACGAVGLANPVLLIAVAIAAAIVFGLAFYGVVEAPFIATLGKRLGARVSEGPATVAP